MNYLGDKKENLQLALYKWLEEIEKIEQDVTNLLKNNNISKAKIAKDIDNMKHKLITLQNNLKKF